ncbi:sugar ABC transporter permease [Streptomyces sp. NBC_01537]|uniref:carbohydrate ABC transporter permease n=1 Tax=Streptomyces sp. NBC_01537 TaxID=2903896 RepID=UPI00387004D1
MSATGTTTRTTGSTARRRRPAERHRSGENRRQAIAGWLFVSPALLILVIFLVVPILLALYVSFTNWDGLSNPLTGDAGFVGLHNYKQLLTNDTLVRQTFAGALRNNFWFVVFVVPAQTALALWLAVLVNNKYLKGKSFFRTAFYFPSITSSIAITLVFLFLFQGGGAVNGLLNLFGVQGPNWLADKRGLFHVWLGGLGVDGPPGWAKHTIMSQSVWDWLSGPSIAMSVIMILVIWTTSGTFMLMFLAALQNISEEVDEAAEIDGAGGWERFRYVTLPMLRPTLLLVLTLGLIGTWQVFDQIYLTGNNPATRTPAFMSFDQSFQNNNFGVGAAIAFLLFGLIMVFSTAQRRLVKEDITS